jgi:crotonobetainyl-CoA:carnitine CoA-transferase CaiB-like acyl-CoA transferase
VVEFCIMAAGPATALQLGELGADVIKIEPPSGDGTRWAHPSQGGMGTNFIAMNAGKRDAVLDVKDPRDLEAAIGLVSGADVFVQNMRGGVAERLGLGPSRLLDVNPGLVYCSISGFGSAGPLAAERCSDTIMQAFSGFARINGDPGMELEQFRFTGFLDLVTASVATQAIVAALVHRQRTGHGQHVDVSMLEAALEIQHTRFAQYLATGDLPAPSGSHSPSAAPDGVFAALDKEVFLSAESDEQWAALCDALGLAGLARDDRFATPARRVQNRALLDELLEPSLLGKPAFWWEHSLSRRGVPAAIPRDFTELRRHVQVTDNAMMAEIGTPWGPIAVGGAPWAFSRTPASVLPPPVPGQDTDAVRDGSVGWSARLRSGESGSSGEAGPGREAGPERPILDGITVVEISQGVAGALAALRLQDLGASVIKIEDGQGDPLRSAPPLAADGTSAVFASLNRGKRLIRLDNDGGDALRAGFRRLLESADIVISDWEQRRADHPAYAEHVGRAADGRAQTIWVEVSDFGAQGPLSGRPGSDTVIQAMAGYTGWIGDYRGSPIRLGADVGSVAAAIFAGSGALAALHARRAGRTGQVVRVSRLGALLSLASIHIAAQSGPDEYLGQRAGGAFFPRIVGWQTADVPIVFAFGGAVGSAGRPGWQKFVDELGAGWLKDAPMFADDPTGRQTTGHGVRVEACRATYESVFKDFGAHVLVEMIRRHGGQAAAFQDYETVVSHPQATALGLVRELASDTGPARATSYPARFSRAATELAGGLRPEAGEPDA